MERKRTFCKEYVSRSTFYTHKDLFFRNGSWETNQEGHNDGQELIKHEEVMHYRRIGHMFNTSEDSIVSSGDKIGSKF